MKLTNVTPIVLFLFVLILPPEGLKKTNYKDYKDLSCVKYSIPILPIIPM